MESVDELPVAWHDAAMIKHKRLRAIFWVTLISLAVGGATLIVVIDQFGQTDRAQHADVLIVLGAQVQPGGRLGPSLERRVQHAAALYQQGLADHVLCSGGVGDHPPAEAQAACDRLIELGVPPDVMVYEDRSHSTEENAAYSIELLRARGWRSVLLVSDGFHLFRATWIFQRAGVEVYPSPAQATVGSMELGERLWREVREVAAVLWYGGRVLLGIDLTNSHP